jgi:hypothetical protein
LIDIVDFIQVQKYIVYIFKVSVHNVIHAIVVIQLFNGSVLIPHDPWTDQLTLFLRLQGFYSIETIFYMKTLSFSHNIALPPTLKVSLIKQLDRNNSRKPPLAPPVDHQQAQEVRDRSLFQHLLQVGLQEQLRAFNIIDYSTSLISSIIVHR